MNQHVAIKLAKVDIRRALAILEVCPDLELDEQLKLSTLQGETELTEIVSILLAENEDDEAMVVGIKGQIDTRRERIARLERRIDTRKNAIVSLMDTAQLRKLPLDEATVSIRTLSPRPKIVDEDAIPDDFKVAVLKPNKTAIDAALERGQQIPGVVMTNGGASLTIRRK